MEPLVINTQISPQEEHIIILPNLQNKDLRLSEETQQIQISFQVKTLTLLTIQMGTAIIFCYCVIMSKTISNWFWNEEKNTYNAFFYIGATYFWAMLPYNYIFFRYIPDFLFFQISIMTYVIYMLGFGFFMSGLCAAHIHTQIITSTLFMLFGSNFSQIWKLRCNPEGGWINELQYISTIPIIFGVLLSLGDFILYGSFRFRFILLCLLIVSIQYYQHIILQRISQGKVFKQLTISNVFYGPGILWLRMVIPICK